MDNKYNDILEKIRSIEKNFIEGTSQEEKDIVETLNNYFGEEELKNGVIEGNNFKNNSISWEHLNYGDYDPLKTSFLESLGFTFRRGSSQIPIAIISDSNNYLDLSDKNNLPEGISLVEKSNPSLEDFGPFFNNYNKFPLFKIDGSNNIINTTNYSLEYTSSNYLKGESSAFSKNYLFYIPNTIFKTGNFSKTRYLTLQFETNFVFEYNITNNITTLPSEYSCLFDVLEFIGKYVAFGFEYSYDGETFYSLPINPYTTFPDSQIYFLDKYRNVVLNSSYFNSDTAYLNSNSFINKGVLISLPLNLFNRCLDRKLESKFNFPILMTNNSFLIKNGIDNVLPLTEYNRSPLSFKIFPSNGSYTLYINFKFGGFLNLNTIPFNTNSIQTYFEIGNCDNSTCLDNMFVTSNPLSFVSLFGGIFLRPKLYFPEYYYFFKDSPTQTNSIFNNIGHSGSINLKNLNNNSICYTQNFLLNKIYNPTIFLSLTNREILQNYIIANRSIYINI